MKKLNKTLLIENIKNSAKTDIENAAIAGAAVIVAQDGEILCYEHFGFSDAKSQKPLQKNALFRLASMTKPVTAVAALIGVQNRWFSLEDKVSDHYPKFENIYVGRLEDGKVIPDHKPKRPVILRQLLSHNSGFMAGGTGALLCTPQENAIPKEAFETNKTAVDYCLKNTCFTFEPSYAAGYSAYFAFDLIGLLIEKHSGMKYADFIKKYIFEPLDITDITYCPTEEQWSRLVCMSERSVGKEIINVDMGRHTFEGFPLTYTCAGAGLVGSIEDYFKFAEMLRLGGNYNGRQIVSSELLALMAKEYVPMEYMHPDEKYSWGLSVRVTHGDPNLPDGAFGWSGAYGTHFFIDPKNKITAIYMKNNRWFESGGGGRTGIQFEKDIMSSFE